MRVGWVTVRVTATDCGLPAAPAELMDTDPLYVPGASPAGLTDTLTLPGIDPPAGEVELSFRLA